MNKRSLLLFALLGAAAVTAQAGELYSPAQYQDAPSTLTRAQMHRTVLQEQKAGELNHNDVDLPGNGTTMSNEPFGRTRASVRADVRAARSSGGLDHNDVDLPNVARGSVLTRQEVKADAMTSRRLVQTAPGRNTIDY